MTPDVLPEAADPKHLTDALRRSGALADAGISDVRGLSSRATVLSRIVRLQLTYDGDAGSAPRVLFLKTALPDGTGKGWNAGRKEVAFYTDVAAAMPAHLVPRCFEAVWDETSNDWHLLLEDLTTSHVIATRWPLPPSTAQCESIIEAWARFHAVWWDDPRLGISVGSWSTEADTDADLQRFAERYAVLPIGWAIVRHRNDAIFTSDFATPRPACQTDITPIEI
jgi:hypothetical protein